MIKKNKEQKVDFKSCMWLLILSVLIWYPFSSKLCCVASHVDSSLELNYHKFNNKTLTSLSLQSPSVVCGDSTKFIYISDTDKVQQINHNMVETIVRHQTHVHFANQSNATSEVTSLVSGLTIDRNGDLYFSSNFNNQLLKFNTKTSLVTQIIFQSTVSTSDSSVGSPGTLFILTSGSTDTLFIADRLSHRIHKMHLNGANLLVSVAGSGFHGGGGDGGPATSCSLGEVRGLWGDSSGHHLYFSDTTFNVVRRVTASTGLVSLLVGSAHNNVFGGGDVSATSASLSGPMAIWGDGSSNSIFIADSGHNRIIQVNPLTRIMTTTVGGDQNNSLNSGIACTSAGMAGPAGVWGDSRGSLFVTEPSQGRVRQISLATGLVSHFAGIERTIKTKTELIYVENNGTASLPVGSTDSASATQHQSALLRAASHNHKIQALGDLTTANLIHRYSFNDGTASDSVGGMDGTLKNGATITNGHAHMNRGGSVGTQYVMLPSNILGSNPNISIEMWYTTGKRNIGGSDLTRLLEIGQSTSSESNTIQLYRDGGNKLRASVLDSTTEFALTTSILFDNHIDDMHLVMTISNSGSYRTVSVYGNGILVLSGTTPVVLPSSAGGGGIGQAFTTGQYMNGTCNEFRVWSTELSAANVFNNYNAGPDYVFPPPPVPSVLPTITPTILPTTMTPTCLPTTMVPSGLPTLIPTTPTVTPTTSVPTTFTGSYLLHRYSFNDGTAGDSVGGKNGVLTNGAVLSNGRVVLNPALKAYVRLPSNLWSGTVDALSFEMWLTTGTNPNVFTRTMEIGDHTTVDGNSVFLTRFSNGVMAGVLNSGGGNFVVSSTTVFESHSTDQHWVMTIQSMNGMRYISLYANGVLTGSSSTANPIQTSSVGGWLGASWKVDQNAESSLNGTINEFRIWSTALSASNVKQNYDNGPDFISINSPTFEPSQVPTVTPTTITPTVTPTTTTPTVTPTTSSPTTFTGSYLLHRYSFNDGTASDSVGGKNGVLTNGAVLLNGRVVLDATQKSHVRLPSGLWSSTSALSFEMWLTTGTNPLQIRAMDFGDYHSDINSIYINKQAANGQMVGVLNYGGGYFVYANTPFDSHPTDQHWVMTLQSVDGRQYINMFVNGVLSASGNTLAIIQTSNAGGWLGASWKSDQNLETSMNGTINEFRIWSTALSADNVKQNYDNGPDFISINSPTIGPTPFPTSQPSRQPTGQPSRQPSSQPSSQPFSKPTTHPSRQPSSRPTQQPSGQPSKQPSMQPAARPSSPPSRQPSAQPSNQPSTQPSEQPSCQPSVQPSKQPSSQPTSQPSRQPIDRPTQHPSVQPSTHPSVQPAARPSSQPSRQPSIQPSAQPFAQPSNQPTRQPSGKPTQQPTIIPTVQPSKQPSSQPSRQPTIQPTSQPSCQPLSRPSAQPSRQPSSRPSCQPSSHPSSQPSRRPIGAPTQQPFAKPSTQPSMQPSARPSLQPSVQPSINPSTQPSAQPSNQPTSQPSSRPSKQPSVQPSGKPSQHPSSHPSVQPSIQPSNRPLTRPSTQPSKQPSCQPSVKPSKQPSSQPTSKPSAQPTIKPSGQPSVQPSMHPTSQPSIVPSFKPTSQPSNQPSDQPFSQPSSQPSQQPSTLPSIQPSVQPSEQPTTSPSSQPSQQPSSQPNACPSAQPSNQPSMQPSEQPSAHPSSQPSQQPSKQPSVQPSTHPIVQPSVQPTSNPSWSPSMQPTLQPSVHPSCQPSSQPSAQPSKQPSTKPSVQPSNQPSTQPSFQPTAIPSMQPSSQPSRQPSPQPSGVPSSQPSAQPSSQPSHQPSSQPSIQPSTQPSVQPIKQPSVQPSALPTSQPSLHPSIQPTVQPTMHPSTQPTTFPSQQPSNRPSIQPSSQPSARPSDKPTKQPSNQPTSQPSSQPRALPSSQPSSQPSGRPSNQPNLQPSGQPTVQPSAQPSLQPSGTPSSQPSLQPSTKPSTQPTSLPSLQPSVQPSMQPSEQPSELPSVQPSSLPSVQPSIQPSIQPSDQPSVQPSVQPTCQPSNQPTGLPSMQPSSQPTSAPSNLPTFQPSRQPTAQPSLTPSSQPSLQPSTQPTIQPSVQPSQQPSVQPIVQPTEQPSVQPSNQPSSQPSSCPTMQPFSQPSVVPSTQPSLQPTVQPTNQPISVPSRQPTSTPSVQPSLQPTVRPSTQPSTLPSNQPLAQPSSQPSTEPSSRPSRRPSFQPSVQPSGKPSNQPSSIPSIQPSVQPSAQPTGEPSGQPSSQPSEQPIMQPSARPSIQPSSQPSSHPSYQPSSLPSAQPATQPSIHPTCQPSFQPTVQPSSEPSFPGETRQPTVCPTSSFPTGQPSGQPSIEPTSQPSMQPSFQPSLQPASLPTSDPSMQPTMAPSLQPFAAPTSLPSSQPSMEPSGDPTSQPSKCPSNQPSNVPSNQPTAQPSMMPTGQPSSLPTMQPSEQPTSGPSLQPFGAPSSMPSQQPFALPTANPSGQPSALPTLQPSIQPTKVPSAQPSSCPSKQPSSQPSQQPSLQPASKPTSRPTRQPTGQPSRQPFSHPSSRPSSQPSMRPTQQPFSQPSRRPSTQPTSVPSTSVPTSSAPLVKGNMRTRKPSPHPTTQPSGQPSSEPTSVPTITAQTLWRNHLQAALYAVASRDNVLEVTSRLNYYEMRINDEQLQGSCSDWQAFRQGELLTNPIQYRVASLQFVLMNEFTATNMTAQCLNNATASHIVNRLNGRSSSDLNETCEGRNWIIRTCPETLHTAMCVDCKNPCDTSATCLSTNKGMVLSPCDNQCSARRSLAVRSSATNVIRILSVAFEEFRPAPQFKSLMLTTHRTSITVETQCSDPGLVFCGLFRNDQHTVPTSQSLIELQGYGSVLMNNSASVTINGLVANTAYDVFCLTRSSSGGMMSLPKMLATKRTQSTLCCMGVDFALTSTSARSGLSAVDIVYVSLDYAPKDNVTLSLVGTNNATGVSTALFFPTSLFVTSNYKLGQKFSFALQPSPAGEYELAAVVVGRAGEFGVYFSNGALLTVFAGTVEPTPPRMTSAMFSADGTAINIQFDSPTDKAALSNRFNCTSLVWFTGANDASCQWISDAQVRAFVSGDRYATVGDTVTLLGGVLRASCAVSTSTESNCSHWVTSPRAAMSLTVPVTLFVPTVSICAPATIGTCTSLPLDVSGSTGSGGRSWNSVSFVVFASDGDASDIESFLTANYRDDGRTSVPSELLLPRTSYYFTVRLCNFMGQCGQGGVRVVVTDSAVPVATIPGLALRQIRRSTPTLSLTSQASLSVCNGSSINDGLSYAWSLSVDSVEKLGVVSQSKEPSKFMIPTQSLLQGVIYTIKLTVTATQSGLLASTSVQVTVIPSKVVAVIRGGSLHSVSVGKSAVLDASLSYDPDSSGVTGVRAGLLFEWSCVQIAPILSDACGVAITSSTLLGETLSVFAPLSSVNSTSRMSLTIYSADKTRWSQSAVSLSVTAVASPLLALSSGIVGQFAVSNKLTLSASITLPSLTSRGVAIWSVDDPSVNLVANALTAVWTNITASGKLYLVLTANSLPSGATLTFRFSCTMSDGVSSVAAISIFTNAPPLTGKFVVSPAAAIALSDPFSFAAYQWTDEDALSYQFGVQSGGATLVIQSRSEFSYATTKLSAGQSNQNFSVVCMLQVFDVFGASTVAQSSVQVTPFHGNSLSLLNDIVLSGSASSDAIKSATTAASLTLNAVDCSLAPDCGALSRSDCVQTVNTCGGCLSDSLIGDAGDSNSACITVNQYNSLVSTPVGNGCKQTTDCPAWYSCVSGVCQLGDKSCPSNCSVQGLCQFRNVNNDEAVTSCAVGSSECSATCSCNTGWFGPTCDISAADMTVRMTLRENIAASLLQLTTLDDPSEETLSGWTAGLTAMSQNSEELSDVSITTAQAVASAILTAASSTGVSYEIVSDILTTLNSIATAQTTSNLQPSRRLLTDSKQAVHLTNTQTMLMQFGQLVANNMVVGEQPLTVVKSQLRLTTQGFSPSVNGDNSSTSVVVSPPATASDILSGKQMPTITLNLTGGATKIITVSLNAVLFGNSDFKSNPLQIQFNADPPCVFTDGACHVEVGLVLQNNVPVNNADTTPPTLYARCGFDDYSEHQYHCADGSVINASCNGTIAMLVNRCPYIQPTTTCNSIGGEGHSNCTVMSYTATNTTCRCLIHITTTSRRLSTQDDGDDDDSTGSTAKGGANFVSMLDYLSKSVLSTVMSADSLSLKSVKSGWKVLATLGSLGFSVLLFAMMAHRTDGSEKKSKHNGKQIKSVKAGPMLVDGVRKTATAVAPQPPQRLSGLQIKSYMSKKRKVFNAQSEMNEIEQSLPNVLRSKPFAERFKEEVKNYHRWIGVVYYYCDSFPRVLRIMSLATNVVAMLFVQSITYSLTNPDDGSCEALTRKNTCLTELSPFGTGDTKCYWEHGFRRGSCHFNQPANNIKVVLFVAILAAIISTPIALSADWVIMNILAARTKRKAVNSPTKIHDLASLSIVPSSRSHLATIKRVAPESTFKRRSGAVTTNIDVNADTKTRRMSLANFLNLDIALSLPTSLQEDMSSLLRELCAYRETLGPTQQAEFSNLWGLDPSGLFMRDDTESHDWRARVWLSKASGGGNNVQKAITGDLRKVRAGLEDEVVYFNKKLKDDQDRGKRMLFLFQRDLLPGVNGKVLDSKNSREGFIQRQVEASTKLMGWAFIVCLNAGMLFYVYLFAMQQTAIRQEAWFKSFAIWLVTEVFFSSTLAVFITHFVMPSLIMRDVGIIKQRLLDSIRDHKDHENQLTAGSTNKDKVFNAAEYLFVSYRLAQKFPDLKESKIIARFSTPWPPQSYHHVNDVSKTYSKKFSALTKSASMVLVFLAGNLVQLPPSLQDTVINICSTGLVGYGALVHLQLFAIFPLLVILPALVIAVLVHFIVQATNASLKVQMAKLAPRSKKIETERQKFEGDHGYKPPRVVSDNANPDFKSTKESAIAGRHVMSELLEQHDEEMKYDYSRSAIFQASDEEVEEGKIEEEENSVQTNHDNDDKEVTEVNQLSAVKPRLHHTLLMKRNIFRPDGDDKDSEADSEESSSSSGDSASSGGDAEKGESRVDKELCDYVTRKYLPKTYKENQETAQTRLQAMSDNKLNRQSGVMNGGQSTTEPVTPAATLTAPITPQKTPRDSLMDNSPEAVWARDSPPVNRPVNFTPPVYSYSAPKTVTAPPSPQVTPMEALISSAAKRVRAMTMDSATTTPTTMTPETRPILINPTGSPNHKSLAASPPLVSLPLKNSDGLYRNISNDSSQPSPNRKTINQALSSGPARGVIKNFMSPLNMARTSLAVAPLPQRPVVETSAVRNTSILFADSTVLNAHDITSPVQNSLKTSDGLYRNLESSRAGSKSRATAIVSPSQRNLTTNHAPVSGRAPSFLKTSNGLYRNVTSVTPEMGDAMVSNAASSGTAMSDKAKSSSNPSASELNSSTNHTFACGRNSILKTSNGLYRNLTSVTPDYPQSFLMRYTDNNTSNNTNNNVKTTSTDVEKPLQVQMAKHSNVATTPSNQVLFDAIIELSKKINDQNHAAHRIQSDFARVKRR